MDGERRLAGGSRVTSLKNEAVLDLIAARLTARSGPMIPWLQISIAFVRVS